MQVLMHIYIGHDPSAERIVFQIVNHPVYLIHHAFFVLMLNPQLIAVRLAYRTVLVRPLVPDMAVKILYVVGFLLPYPEDFVGSAFDSRLP